MLDKNNPPFTKKSGVSARAYREYKFESHVWYTGIEEEGVAGNFAKFARDLANYIIKVDGAVWIRDPISSEWTAYKSDKNAMLDAKNKFLNTRMYPSNHLITNEDLNSYFSGVLKVEIEGIDGETREHIFQVGSMPNQSGTISIPFGPQYIEYKNSTFLNTWKDTSVSGNEAHSTQGLAVLRMLYRSLCAGEELDPDPAREIEMLLEQVRTNTYTNETFRFVLNWFAAIYQRPGINLLTNLWFVSTLEGIGKSLFVDLNARTVGYNNFFRMLPSEIERGWNDCLVGKQLIEFDEFPRTKRFDWPSWIKRTTIAAELMVSGRGRSQTNIINVGNYVFSLNPRKDGDIIELGSTDRRNVFVQGSDDEHWKAYSTGIATRYVQDWEPFALGWAWVLEQVQLDLKLVNSNHSTALKAEMVEDAANEDVIMGWLKNDATLAHNTRYQAADFWEKYASWVKIYSPSHSGPMLISLTKFCTRVKKYPGIHNLKPNNRSYYVIQPAPVMDRAAAVEKGRAEIEAIFTDGVESEAVVIEETIAAPTQLDQLRERLRRESDDYEVVADSHREPVVQVIEPELEVEARIDTQSILDAVRGRVQSTATQPVTTPIGLSPEVRERMEKNEKLRELSNKLRDV